MKIVVVFLLVSLNCCLGSLPADKKNEPVVPVPKVIPEEPQPAPKPVPKMSCLIQLLKKDAPVLLQKIGNLICNYQVAKKEQNIALFVDFLNQVNNILKEVGCSLNNLLGTHVVINAQDAEMLADEVSLILFQFVDDIIAGVMKVLEEIPIIGDLINDVPLNQDIRDLACGVLESYLSKIAKILNIIAEITGGIKNIIDGL